MSSVHIRVEGLRYYEGCSRLLENKKASACKYPCKMHHGKMNAVVRVLSIGANSEICILCLSDALCVYTFKSLTGRICYEGRYIHTIKSHLYTGEKTNIEIYDIKGIQLILMMVRVFFSLAH